MSKEQILEVLKTVNYPGFSRGIVDFGLVKSVEQLDGAWKISLKVTTSDPSIGQQLSDTIKPALAEQIGLHDVQVETEILAPQQTGPPKAAQAQAAQQVPILPGVQHKVAVASGKGGVGKSTVACNLAIALAQAGHAVGLFDADIYGPSLPMMMGTSGEKPKVANEKLQPVERYGIKMMSIGYFIKDDDPVIWRGPMVMKAIEQFLRDVDWGKLDYLIIDLPPGTGDAQLSLSQLVSLTGAVVVSTPQDVALLDAVKGVLMFKHVNVPILGIVENMSFFECPHCKERSDIFSHGGGERACEDLEVPFLGSIPIHLDVRAGGDSGTPLTHSSPDSTVGQAFKQIADAVVKSSLQEPDVKISV
jgi:ATP-binding protein involved in chromosome partitioning